MSLLIIFLVTISAGIVVWADCVINTMRSKETPFVYKFSYCALATLSALNVVMLIANQCIEWHFFLVFIPLLLVALIERRKEVRVHAEP